MKKILVVKNLSIAFPATDDEVETQNVELLKVNGKMFKVVLSDVSFELARGEILGLVGESGSGKSITSLATMNLLPRNAEILSGEVMFYDKDKYVDFLSLKNSIMRKRYRGNRISMIMQDPKGTFSPISQVGKQIMRPLKMHKGMKTKEAESAAKELLKSMYSDNDEALANYSRIPSRLSGGQAQRASIAMMALAAKPDILIADEATTALDVTVQAQVLDDLVSIVENMGISLIFITHDFGLVAEYANRMIVLDKGRVVEDGKVQEVFNAPKSTYMNTILANLPRMDKPLRKSRPSSFFSKKILEVENLKVVFSQKVSKGILKSTTESFIAIDNISFSIYDGETLGVVGESGSGKTTLMRSILRVLPDSAEISGKINVLNCDMYEMNNKDLRAFRQKIGGVPQSSKQSLTPRIRVINLVSEALDIHNLYNSKNKASREQEKTDRVIELLRSVEFPSERMNDFPERMSGGEQQRVAIASALATNPQILILDEPTASLDASRKNTILKLLLKLQNERGLSYMLISHELSTIASVCDRVLVMWKGRIVEIGTPAQVFSNSKHIYTKILVVSEPSPDPTSAARERSLRKKGLVMPDFSSRDLLDLESSVLEEVQDDAGHFFDLITNQLFLDKI